MRGNNSFLLKIAINLFFLYSIINCLLVWSGHTYSLTFSIIIELTLILLLIFILTKKINKSILLGKRIFITYLLWCFFILFESLSNLVGKQNIAFQPVQQTINMICQCKMDDIIQRQIFFFAGEGYDIFRQFSGQRIGIAKKLVIAAFYFIGKYKDFLRIITREKIALFFSESKAKTHDNDFFVILIPCDHHIIVQYLLYLHDQNLLKTKKNNTFSYSS